MGLEWQEKKESLSSTIFPLLVNYKDIFLLDLC